MDSNDTYEEQLLAVFESCNGCEEGSLSRSGLQQLCEKLQLEEHCGQLTSWLLADSHNSRITFQEFHESLVKLLNISREEGGREGGISPAREVSPKYVFGKKKYGRRSRPETSEEGHMSDDGNSSGASSSDVEYTISKKRKTRSEQAQELFTISTDQPTDLIVASSSSSTPTEPVSSTTNEEELLVAAWSTVSQDLQHTSLARGELVKVFECVGLESGSDEAAQRVFEKLEVLQDGRITLQDLLGCVRSGAEVNPHTPSCPSQELLDSSPVGYVSGRQLVEQWESAGVPGAQQLLRNLGHSTSLHVDLASLAAMLTEEVKTMSEGSKLRANSHSALLRASLVIHQIYVQGLKTSLEHMAAEREKLRSDVVEANHRALLLAQEVDEHHTKLEHSTQRQVRELEQRHAEKIRELTLEVKTDEEQLTSQNSLLENKVERLETEETKCKAKLAQLEVENKSLELEHQAVLDQLSLCMREKEKLEKNVESLSGLQQKLCEMEAKVKQHEMMTLLERITCLETENRDLRDRNDELSIEVESLTSQLHNTTITKRSSADDSMSEEAVGCRTKRRGKAYLMTGSTEDSGEETDSPRLGKVRRCDDFESGLEGLQIHSLSHGESIEEGLDDHETAVGGSSDGPGVLSGTDKCRPVRHVHDKRYQLSVNVDDTDRSLLGEIKDMVDCECQTLEGTEKEELRARCKELETSLELMREEYEKTEDYWAEKLEEERVLFEQEQKQSDEKYGELVERILEYEEMLRLERDQKNKLETIDERVSLEKQVTDIEEECTALRGNFTAELQLKDDEIERLRKEIEAQERNKTDAICQAGEQGEQEVQPSRRCKGTKRSLTFSSGDRKLRYCPCCRTSTGNARLSGEVKSLTDSKARLQREVDLLLGERGALYKEVLDKRRELGSYMASIVSAGGGSRAQYLEQRCHSLMVALQQQQRQAEELLNSTWKQHKAEVRELKHVLQSTEEKLRSQTDVIREQLTKLARTDTLVKDLFVENAYLVSSVHKLEQQCHAYKTGEFTV